MSEENAGITIIIKSRVDASKVHVIQVPNATNVDLGVVYDVKDESCLSSFDGVAPVLIERMEFSFKPNYDGTRVYSEQVFHDENPMTLEGLLPSLNPEELSTLISSYNSRKAAGLI